MYIVSYFRACYIIYADLAGFALDQHWRAINIRDAKRVPQIQALDDDYKQTEDEEPRVEAKDVDYMHPDFRHCHVHLSE